jgi:hypothetical protein
MRITINDMNADGDLKEFSALLSEFVKYGRFDGRRTGVQASRQENVISR